jgi:hypothetical protein
MGARQLSRAGTPVHLTRKALDLLEMLAARHPDAVGKADIHTALWPDTFVSDANLASIVFEIRTALGETARRPRFIRTVHGFGYAFEPEPAPNASAPACRLVIEGDTIELGPGEHLVGRSRQCSVRFESARVSRIHARLTIIGAIATLEDLSSRNGTFVRGQRIAGVAPLFDGDEIVFGSARVVFESAGAGTRGTQVTDE